MSKSKEVTQAKIDPVPVAGFLRINQIVKVPGSKDIPLIPISRSSWLSGIKEGKYPAPLKLGPKTNVWRAEDIRKLLESLGA